VPTKEVDNVSIQKLLGIVKHHKLAIALPTLLMAGVFAVYAYYLPARYEAKALLALDPNGMTANVQMPTIEEQLVTVREIVLGRPFLEKIVAEFELYPPTGDAVDAVKLRIPIDVVSAKAFHVGFQSEDPEVAARVANRLADLFVSQTASAQTRNVAQTTDLLQEGLQSLRGRLAAQLDRIQNYKEKVGGALPERLDRNLKVIEVLDDRLQSANTRIASDQATRAAVVKEMSELEKRGALEPAVSREKTADERKLDEARLELARLRAKYTEQHTEVKNLVKEVKDLEKNQAQGTPSRAEPSALSLRYLQLGAELEGIDQRLQSQRQEVTSLTSELLTNRVQVSTVPQHESQIAFLMRDYATTQASYQELLGRQNVAGIVPGPGPVSSGLLFKVAEPARTPLTPYSPLRVRIILMGLFAGLGVGGVLAFVREQLNTSFLNAEEFAAFSSMPVLAEIPSISKVDGGNTNASRLVTVKQPSSVAAEMYFTLAEKVRKRCLGKTPVILAITSSTGGEGKTLTSLNLSLALAKSYCGKVLLVDADLRRPMLHDYLELDRTSTKGFGDLLQNPEDDIHKYIIDYHGLSVMPTFGRIANPLGMLSSTSARAILERMSKDFAFVVLDSPPIAPIADGHVLTNLADHVLLIARARRTPRELFKLATESLDCSTVIGVALNDVDLKHSRYSTAYQYYQENYQARS
jgi:succinoglycan biosynthesis transport protein ExoP